MSYCNKKRKRLECHLRPKFVTRTCNKGLIGSLVERRKIDVSMLPL